MHRYRVLCTGGLNSGFAVFIRQHDMPYRSEHVINVTVPSIGQ